MNILLLLVSSILVNNFVLATFLGSKLQKKISQERFLKLTYVLLLCVGVILLVTS